MKTQTKYKDQKRRISGESQDKEKIEQKPYLLRRKRKRNESSNKIINESSTEKATIEDSQKYQRHINEPMG